MSLLGKIKKFFEKPKSRQRQKVEKLEKLIAKLLVKAEKLKRRLDRETKAPKKERLMKEYRALGKLLQKSRNRLAFLKEG